MFRILRLLPRLVVTLALAPLLYQLVVVYLASQQGSTLAALMAGSGDALRQIYLTFTLPALAIIIVALWPIERLMRLLGLDLLSIAMAPPLAWAAAFVMGRLIGEERVPGAADMTSLAVAYGIVWGLTIRELPPRVKRAKKVAKPAPVADPANVATSESVAAVVAGNLAAVAPVAQRAAPAEPASQKVAAIVASNLRNASPEPGSATNGPTVDPSEKVATIVAANADGDASEADEEDTSEDQVADVVAANADEAASGRNVVSAEEQQRRKRMRRMRGRRQANRERSAEGDMVEATAVRPTDGDDPARPAALEKDGEG